MVTEIVLKDSQNLRELKESEFESGLRPKSSKIGKYASEGYAKHKNAMNPKAGLGNVDLIYTGAFVNSLFVKPFSKGYIFDSNNSKSGNLIGKYGLDIMGLNQETFNKRQNDFYRFELIKNIKTKYKIA